jgi:hypothetical protein
MFGFWRRRRPVPLDEVRAIIIEIEPDGTAWAKPLMTTPSPYARIPIERRRAKKLGLHFGVLVDCGIDPDTLLPRRVQRASPR